MKLFQKNIEPRCAYCARGKELGGRIACVKKGIVEPDFHCRGFQYDPLKRTPPRQGKLDFSKWKDEDFAL